MRYLNQIQVDQVGEEGQKLISDSHILVVGLGGLGSIVSQYLAGAGVGKLSICDSDRVDLSNLHRQIVHRENTIGQYKTASAIAALRGINSSIEIEGLIGDIRDLPFNAPTQIVDCTDNKETKLWLDDYAENHNIALVSAGVGVFSAQLYNVQAAQVTRLSHVISKAKNPEKHITLGPVCGIVGSLQSLFVLYNCLKIQVDYNSVLINTMDLSIQKMMLP